MRRLWVGWAAVVLAMGVWVVPAGAEPAGGLSLDLVGEDGLPVAHLVPIAGTIIVTRNDAAAGGAAEPADKLDMVFGPSIWADKAVLRWLGGGGARAGAVFTVAVGRADPVVYTLTGISVRSLSVTAQGGDGQASFVLGAAHVSVGGAVIN